MMGRATQLARFIDELPKGRRPGPLELVIAGDFVDFLALTPYAPITTGARQARKKLQEVMASSSPYGCVFTALARHLARGDRLTILVGNHDVELALPGCQSELLHALQATQHDVHFVDDGRAYRVGGVLIEHGNSYDAANCNDWIGLRHLASMQSRGSDEAECVPSPGSRLVYQVINPLKQRYPHISLLQPEGELLALLLLAFEPKLRHHVNDLAALLRAQRLSGTAPTPGPRFIASRQKRKKVAADATEPRQLPQRVKTHFPDHRAFEAAPAQQPIGATKAWLKAWTTGDKESLSWLLQHDRSIPEPRLQQLRVGLKEILDTDASDNRDGDAGEYGKAAQRMLSQDPGLQLVVMGHTHLPRHKKYSGGEYINTGTWVDRCRIPEGALQRSEDLLQFLRDFLISGALTPLPPTYADISLRDDGKVETSKLEDYGSRP